jgi:hypothetical protein
LNPHSDHRTAASQNSETSEEVKLLAYQLWLGRRNHNISGDANCDYYQAERILESRKNLKRLLLGSFGFSAVAFVLGHSQEEHYTNAANALIGLNELVEQDLSVSVSVSASVSASASASASGDGSNDAA